MRKIISFLFVMSVFVFDANSETNKYIIGAGDVLHISVWEEESLQKEVIVTPSGFIAFPLIGEVKAAGENVTSLTELLAEKLKGFITNVNVTVSVIKSVSNRVYVIGEVNRPGQLVTLQYMDVLQALTMAGGLTPFADSDNIKILRRSEGGKEVFEFDYDEVISGESMEMNILLKAGDTIVVP